MTFYIVRLQLQHLILPASNPASAIPIILLNKTLTDTFIQYIHIRIESLWLVTKWSYALLSQNITKPPFISLGESLPSNQDELVWWYTACGCKYGPEFDSHWPPKISHGLFDPRRLTRDLIHTKWSPKAINLLRG